MPNQHCCQMHLVMSTQKLFSYVCMTLLLIVIVFLFIPTYLVFDITRQTSRMMEGVVKQFESTASNIPIATGGNKETFAEAYERLLEHTALPGEAAHAARLHVNLVTFEPAKDSMADNRDADYAQAAVALDISELDKAAVLLVNAAPVTWMVEGADPFKRAKIALEGTGPVNAINLTQGLIAGIRNTTYEARNATRPNDMANDLHRFCRSLRAWANQFDLSVHDISIWTVRLPFSGARLTVNDSRIKADKGRAFAEGSMAGKCARYR